MKKFLSIATKVLFIVLICVVLSITILSVVSSCRGSSVKVSADQADIESPLNQYYYQNANLTPYDLDFFAPIRKNGTEFKFNNDGSITVTSIGGNNGSYTQLVLSRELKLPLGTYSFTGYGPVDYLGNNFSLIYNLNYTDGHRVTYPSNVAPGYTFEVTDDVEYLQCYITINTLYHLQGVGASFTIFPMLNVGTEVLPYIPSLDYVYNYSYNQTIYQNASLDLGVFLNSTFDIEYMYNNLESDEDIDSDWFKSTGLTPNFTYNGINFNSWYSANEIRYIDGDRYLLESAEVTINFAQPFNYYAFPVYFIGTSDVFSGRFIDDTGKGYVVDFSDTWSEVPAFRTIKVADGVSIPNGGFNISKLVIQFGRASDTLQNSNFVVMTEGYLNGYNDGYYKGESNLEFQKKNAKEQGYNEGYYLGKEHGYNLGFQDGTSGELTAGNFFRKVFDILDVKIFGVVSIADMMIILVGAWLALLTLKLFAGG